MSHANRPPRARRARRLLRSKGLSLIETSICVLLVGGLCVAAMNTVGASRRTQFSNAQGRQGLSLAEDLMFEILMQHYEEPDDTVEFGRESESGGDCEDWDDVDDYDGWSQSPPEHKDESPITSAANHTRTVMVARINPADLSLQIPDATKRLLDVGLKLHRQVPARWAIIIDCPAGLATKRLLSQSDG
jgi:Tfp pilus assembly protein PilV